MTVKVYGVFMIIEAEDGESYSHLWSLYRTRKSADAKLAEMRRAFIAGTLLEVQELTVEE